MTPLTCQAASDQLGGVLSDAEQGVLAHHLAGCDSCSCLMEQLHTTIAVLGSRPEVQVPDSLRLLVTRTDHRLGEALTAQLPSLYALAKALDADAADDLVQDTLTSALADPCAEATGTGLAATLTRLATERGPEFESPAVPTVGSDPDADEPELFYPDFYTDGPDAGAWVDPPVAWGEALVARPEDDVVMSEVYDAVESVLAELDPIDAGLVTLVDIEGTSFSRAVLELQLSSVEARQRLVRARLAVRAALDRYLQR